MNTISYKPIKLYRSHIEQLSKLINDGPYKTSFICDKLKISRGTLYNKRKSKNFTLDEVEKLTELFSSL